MSATFRSFSRLAPVILTALAAVACGSEDADSSLSSKPGSERTAGSSSGGTSGTGGVSQTPAAPNTSGAAQRAIEEADIVQVQNGRLYALSKTGSLSIIDVSKPNQLAMLGQAYLPGEPFEMYLSGDRLTLMMNGVYSPTGQVVPASGAGATYKAPEVNGAAGVLVIDVKDPGLLQRVGTFAVPGEIADSRLAGNTLYIVTYQNGGCWSCTTGNSTLVTSFDLTSPSTLKQVGQVAFAGSTMGYGDAYKRSMIFGNGHLWVGGQEGTGGTIDLVDASDPGGKLEKGAHIVTAGPIVSRWQMSEKDSVLRVVSQQGTSTTPTAEPQIETFTVWNARSVQNVAKVPLKLPRMEALKAVRFDADRAYAITFQRTDPLFIIDLKDPAKPQQRGELEMPGYVVHLEPRGDRLIGLGVDDRDAGGNLNVSLFDVSNMDAPKMLSRVSFGNYGGTNETVQSTVLPEDQDRLQKAFRINESGLITVPYSSPRYDSCAAGGGVQLINWQQDTLQKQATLPMAGNPRRALVNQNQLLAVSDSNVTSFDITQRSSVLQTADLVIGTCELRTASNTGTPMNGWEGGGRGNFEGGWSDWEGDDQGAFACSSTRTGGTRTTWATALVGLGLVAGAIRRRLRVRGGACRRAA